jgi:hypothetical protein
MSVDRGPIDEPEVVSVDQEAEQQDLEDAGWVRLYRQGKLLWQHPESGHLYPRGPAIRRLRMASHEGARSPYYGREGTT